MSDERRDDLPHVGRAMDLTERAWAEGNLTVLGWADDSVVSGYDERLVFDVTKTVTQSHEDEVLIIAIRVPHPDAMTLDEVLDRVRRCGPEG